MKRLTVDVRPGEYSIAKLPSGSPVPSLPTSDGLVSITSTPDELSVVSLAGISPAAEKVDEGWRLLTVRGPLEFTLTGIMASLAGSLAAAGVSLYAMSTFDTDHILVKGTDLDRAVAALREAGHEVHA
ncbi:ACT domain-containing protein [Kibdelosporangium philippinense]|uniref:ACT domain-containing protein n=1 Tax=Kibdelosporangium philippinense TaxID=211113 RepID=A0ABS8ZII8_9PSEU|nr:ACT domain-containing protein [Kibdelosporangium philippinense]MCE7007565.1 ACT domain-containing protein [Kibdelosporangium philippinense]